MRRRGYYRGGGGVAATPQEINLGESHSIQVRCNGKLHIVIFSKNGRLGFINHPEGMTKTIQFAQTARIMGDEKDRWGCVRVLALWNRVFSPNALLQEQCKTILPAYVSDPMSLLPATLRQIAEKLLKQRNRLDYHNHTTRFTGGASKKYKKPNKYTYDKREPGDRATEMFARKLKLAIEQSGYNEPTKAHIVGQLESMNTYSPNLVLNLPIATKPEPTHYVSPRLRAKSASNFQTKDIIHIHQSWLWDTPLAWGHKLCLDGQMIIRTYREKRGDAFNAVEVLTKDSQGNITGRKLVGTWM